MRFNNTARESLYLSLVCILCVSPVCAQDNETPGTAPATTVAEQPESAGVIKKNFWGLDYSGYIDGSYNYLVRSNHFTSDHPDRVYDLNENGLTLQQAAITVSRLPDQGLGGLANVVLGRDANSLAPIGINPQSMMDSENLGFTPVQAYLRYVRGAFTLMAGNFVTLAGEEYYDPGLDTTYSRSILYYSTPNTHLGVRGIYAANEKLTITAGVNNGWDNITDFSRHKTLELGMSYAFNPKLSFSLQGYSGQERAMLLATSGSLGQRSLVDFVATLKASSKWSFATEYDYIWQSQALLPDGNLARAEWQGIAGYVDYKFNDIWQTALRAEYFDDQNGYITGVRQNWREITLSLGYTPIKNFVVRLETRHDFSDVSSFVNSNGVTTNNNNQSFALEGYYQF